MDIINTKSRKSERGEVSSQITTVVLFIFVLSFKSWITVRLVVSGNDIISTRFCFRLQAMLRIPVV